MKKEKEEKYTVEIHDNGQDYKQNMTMADLKKSLNTESLYPPVRTEKGLIYICEIVKGEWRQFRREVLDTKINMTPEQLANIIFWDDCINFAEIPPSWAQKTRAVLMIVLIVVLLFAVFILGSAVFD